MAADKKRDGLTNALDECTGRPTTKITGVTADSSPNPKPIDQPHSINTYMFGQRGTITISDKQPLITASATSVGSFQAHCTVSVHGRSCRPA